MIASTLALGLIGLASASPLARREGEQCGSYPPTTQSQGFNLIVNVTDPSTDFTPSIQNNFITTIHTGAGLALVGVSEKQGPVFYQNGTADDEKDHRATVVTDLGTPETPAGLKLVTADGDSDGVKTASLDFGYGTPGVQLSTSPEPYRYLLPDTYLACNQSLEYYQGKYFIIIKQVEVNTTIPEDCAAIRLIPQAAELEELSKDAFASHDFALESEVYEQVSEIDWNEYSS